ncbi:MAG: hypothetical protein IKS20_03255 [Victivallales bacterium]|nr:hypothetical protein [Victivallales bacterium]
MADTNNRICWYVLQVMSGREKRVFNELSGQCSADLENVVAKDAENARNYCSQFKGLLYGIYELNIPYEKVEEHKQGKTGKKAEKVERERLLYPGYVLIRMQLFDENGKLIPDNWNFIRGTANVIGFLGTGEFPTPLTDEEAARMTHEDEAEDEQMRPRVQYNVGEAVIIKEGAFEHCEGVIESVDDEHGRLKVSVSIFGRYTSVEAEFWQVERP